MGVFAQKRRPVAGVPSCQMALTCKWKFLYFTTLVQNFKSCQYEKVFEKREEKEEETEEGEEGPFQYEGEKKAFNVE